MSRTYVGRRSKRGGKVEVFDAHGVAPLPENGARQQQPAGPPVFDWGPLARPSTALARSLLRDLLGYEPSDGIVAIFAADIVRHLPWDGFVLDEVAIRVWLRGHQGRGLGPSELVEHLGRVALADADEEAEELSSLIERCWPAHSLRQ